MTDAELPIAVVVVDRECAAQDIAADAGIPCELVERTDFGPDFDRRAFTERVVRSLRDAQVDLVAMAGWGTILSAEAFEAYPGRILNTHPSLLPAFPGWNAVAAALEYGVKITGCTVHVATEQVDAGPILAQEAVPVFDDDDVECLHERIKVVERRLYVTTIKDILERRRVL